MDAYILLRESAGADVARLAEVRFDVFTPHGSQADTLDLGFPAEVRGWGCLNLVDPAAAMEIVREAIPEATGLRHPKRCPCLVLGMLPGYREAADRLRAVTEEAEAMIHAAAEELRVVLAPRGSP